MNSKRMNIENKRSKKFICITLKDLIAFSETGNYHFSEVSGLRNELSN